MQAKIAQRPHARKGSADFIPTRSSSEAEDPEFISGAFGSCAKGDFARRSVGRVSKPDQKDVEKDGPGDPSYN